MFRSLQHVVPSHLADPTLFNFAGLALGGALPQADVIVSAVNVQEPVVTLARHQALLKPQGVLMVDIGMPRNIDPAFDACGGGVRVADLDVLKRWYRAANGTLDQVLKACGKILNEHRDIYERMRRSIQGAAQQAEP